MMKMDRENPEDPPEVLRWDNCKQALADLVTTKSGSGADGSIYGHEMVRRALLALYYNKCAYCEIKVFEDMEVEHFRPKASSGRIHGGYYWLAYAWSNLLPVCHRCNNKKSSQFPLEDAGERVTAPPCDATGELIEAACKPDHPRMLAEQPLLLHPEWDNPAEHFTFHADGRMTGDTERDLETIKVCGLFEQRLTIPRKTLRDEFLGGCEKIYAEWIEKKISTKEFQTSMRHCIEAFCEEIKPDAEYLAFRKAAHRNVSEFFLKGMPPKRRRVMEKAFRRYGNMTV